VVLHQVASNRSQCVLQLGGKQSL